MLYATVELAEFPGRRLFVLAASPITYGIFMEPAQAPLPDQYYATGDMLANTLGVLIALAWLFDEGGIRCIEITNGI